MQDTKASPQGLTFQQTLERVISHLDAEDTASVAVACATLCVLLSQSTEEAALDGLPAKLLKLLSRSSVEVQRNAVAALSAAVDASDAALQEALDSKAAHALVVQLQQGVADQGLAANLLAALGALAEASPEGAQAVVDAGGVEALVGRCRLEEEAQLQECAVDALCKLAGQGDAMRAMVVEKGAIPALASLLGSDSAEVRVRCLLGLGMLVGGSAERQVALAAVPGAPAQLLALMRQGEDDDCQHIAASIFAELATNPAAKDSIAAALKAGR